MVHLGTLSRDGSMTLQPGALRAYVYAIDAARDLALLRVERAPGAAPLPFLALAEAGARPGVPIVVVGHPAAGMLWTVRTGEVASVGRMPADMVNTVMTRLSAADSRRDDIASALARLTSRRIILTSAGINPGDSGGPVLDAAGRVVAVTFAVPASPSLAKFSYHMHLDELKVFLQDVPSAPRLVPPDPWALGPQVALDDLDGDRRPDVLVAGDEEPDTFLFDLDNDTPLASRPRRPRLAADVGVRSGAAIGGRSDDGVLRFERRRDDRSRAHGGSGPGAPCALHARRRRPLAGPDRRAAEADRRREPAVARARRALRRARVGPRSAREAGGRLRCRGPISASCSGWCSTGRLPNAWRSCARPAAAITRSTTRSSSCCG
jgi:hypothetical protein